MPKGASYSTKPAQFRIPRWAHEFLAQESAEKQITKTEVLVRALECYREREHNAELREGYKELGEFLLEEVRDWDTCGVDASLEDEQWGPDAQG